MSQPIAPRQQSDGSLPIEEFDPEPQAFIEPGKVIRPRDVAPHCVACFFLEVLDKVTTQYGARVVAENRWENGPHHLYEIAYNGRRLCYYHPGIGSAQAAGLMEEVIAFGCRKFVACGGCGSLDRSVTLGQLVCLTGAVRDEGASYHYLPPSREVEADKGVLKVITGVMARRGVPFVHGKTWSTDAPYRETGRASPDVDPRAAWWWIWKPRA